MERAGINSVICVLGLVWVATIGAVAQDAPQADKAPDAVTPEATSAAAPIAVPDAAAADPQDPFVRGLLRLDERLKLQREAEELAKRALELQKQAEERAAREAAGEPLDDLEGAEEEIVIPAPISDPDFFTAFAARKYRLDGLVLSRPAKQPVIHIFEEKIARKTNAFYWSGKERRWVYERYTDEKIASIAKRMKMLPADLLAMNNVLREEQLPDPKRFFVSPRDNGPLIHIIVKGDSLAKLAKIYDTDAARLRVRNKLDDKARLVIGKRLLVREKTINESLARMAQPAPSRIETERLEQARNHYARLGQYADKSEALRQAREFYARYYDFMDSDITLRLERDESQDGKRFYNMDIGPLRSPRHGEAYCALFRIDDLPCLVVARVPGPERDRNFDSQAIISVTPYVYYDGDDKLDSGRTDVEKLTKLEYFLTEGQELGNAEGTIAKITSDRILLTDANGYLLTLPLNQIPEIDPIEKAKKEAAARQAAVNQAAAAAGAGAAAVNGADVTVPGPEDTALGQKLQANEAKRREGSGGFIKDLAAKPEKLDK